MKQPCIVFTGGGTAGHVTPNLAIIDALPSSINIIYMGSQNGIEKQLLSRRTISYFAINSEKLRRHFAWQTLLAPFKIAHGVMQAWRHLKRIRPHCVFSKGGFVAFPVVIAAWLRRIPVICHESDLTPGLANRLCYPFAQRICVSFPETKAAQQHTEKFVLTGNPIRQAIIQGDAANGRQYCHFDNAKPVLLVMGGGLGAARINKALRQALAVLLMQYDIVHLCGHGKMDKSLQGYSGYQQFEYIDEAMPDLLAMADLIISRAGANSIAEIIALKKPHILIPLSIASRGDQIENAAYYRSKMISHVLPDKDCEADNLIEAIANCEAESQQSIANMQNYALDNAVEKVCKLIDEYLPLRSSETDEHSTPTVY